MTAKAADGEIFPVCEFVCCGLADVEVILHLGNCHVRAVFFGFAHFFTSFVIEFSKKRYAGRTLHSAKQTPNEHRLIEKLLPNSFRPSILHL